MKPWRADTRLYEFASQAENLVAFLLLIEDTPGAKKRLDDMGFSEVDFENLKFYALKLVRAFIPKKLAS